MTSPTRGCIRVGKRHPRRWKETFTRRIYLHLFFNPTKRVEEDAAFDHDLLELKSQLEEGTSVEELSASGQEKAAKYLQIRHYRSKTTVACNGKAIRERKEENGYFALVSNCEKEPFECLHKYHRRETIEFFFEAGSMLTEHVYESGIRTLSVGGCSSNSYHFATTNTWAKQYVRWRSLLA